jgi:hypothetical protein
MLIREVNFAYGTISHSEAVSSDPNPSCLACGRADALYGQFGCFIWPLVLAMLLVCCGGYIGAIYNAADSDRVGGCLLAPPIPPPNAVLVPLGVIWLYLAIVPTLF